MSARAAGRGSGPPLTPKILGCDTELGNFVSGDPATGWTSGAEAAFALLGALPGVPARAIAGRTAREEDPRDRGRRFFAGNGGGAYVDLGHLELTSPEVRSAADFTAAWQAMLRLATAARAAVNRERPPDRRVVLQVCNSDGHGSSWGGHVSVLVSRAAFDATFYRRLYPELMVLASGLVSSIVITGQGKVGAENGRPPIPFQLTQRGDFFECLVAERTTSARPLVNARDEPLCGAGARARHARLHLIFFDSTLAPVATFLKAGIAQALAALLEAGSAGPALVLDDPLAALEAWGRDPALRALARLADGRRVRALDHQRLCLEAAARLEREGRLEGAVPGAPELIALWADTLDRLEAGDLDALAPRLDWVAKRLAIEDALARRPRESWSGPLAKRLDLLWGELDPARGLHASLARSGFFDPVVAEERVERLTREPPDDTRAFARAHLLRRLPARLVDGVDWDRVRVRVPGVGTAALELPDPAGHTREDCGEALAGARSLGDLASAVGGRIDLEPDAAELAGGSMH